MPQDLVAPAAPPSTAVAVADRIGLGKSLIAQIETINYCNRKCSFCFLGHFDLPEPQTMSMDLYRRVLDELLSLGRPVDYIAFSSYGEPTLDPHFKARLREIGQRGLRYWNITNGTRLTEDLVEFFLAEPDLYARFFLINVPTIDDGLYERLAGAPAAQAQQMREGLHRLGPHLRPHNLSATLTVLGANDEAHQRQIDAITREFVDYGYTVSRGWLNDRAGELRPFVDNNIFVPKVGGCSDGRLDRYLHIGVKGNVYLCCHDYWQRYSYGVIGPAERLGDILAAPRRDEMVSAMTGQMCRHCVSAVPAAS